MKTSTFGRFDPVNFVSLLLWSLIEVSSSSNATQGRVNREGVPKASILLQVNRSKAVQIRSSVIPLRRSENVAQPLKKKSIKESKYCQALFLHVT